MPAAESGSVSTNSMVRGTLYPARCWRQNSSSSPVVTPARGARTMALDPATHRIYVAAAKYQNPPADAPANARPTLVPGSMHMLVYGIGGK